jgi:hypothetical protein
MKSVFSMGLVLACTGAMAQSPAPVQAQLPAPAGTVVTRPLKPDTVVATVDGRKFTAAELNAIANSFQGMRQNMTADPKTFLERYGVLLTLGKMAESKGLDKETPNKERLEYTKLQILWQAMLDRQYNDIPVSTEDAKQYYEQNKDSYSSVKIKAVYIPFSPAPPPQSDPKAKKVLSEPDALEQANLVIKKARGGEDFVKLVKEYSQDPNSSSKDGDFGTFRKSDKIPDHIKQAIFALKTGEVSEPVKQPNGFYVFYAVEAGQQDFEHAQGTVIGEIRDRKLQEWLLSIGKNIKVSIENEGYFKPAPGAPATPAATK